MKLHYQTNRSHNRTCTTTTVLFCSLAVLDPRVGHTMDVLFPFISVLWHSNRIVNYHHNSSYFYISKTSSSQYDQNLIQLCIISKDIFISKWKFTPSDDDQKPVYLPVAIKVNVKISPDRQSQSNGGTAIYYVNTENHAFFSIVTSKCWHNCHVSHMTFSLIHRLQAHRLDQLCHNIHSKLWCMQCVQHSRDNYCDAALYNCMTDIDISQRLQMVKKCTAYVHKIVIV